jgi:hypothetical protein
VKPALLGTTSVQFKSERKAAATGSTRLRPIHFSNRAETAARSSASLQPNHYEIVMFGKEKFLDSIDVRLARLAIVFVRVYHVNAASRSARKKQQVPSRQA